MTDKTELKPCPFCGDGIYLEVLRTEGTILHPHHYVKCGNCGARSGGAYSGNHVKQWNTRTTPADWESDSSLETWFPYTAKELKALKDENERLRNALMEVQELSSAGKVVPYDFNKIWHVSDKALKGEDNAD